MSPRVAAAAVQSRPVSRTEGWTFPVLMIGVMILTSVWRLQDMAPILSMLQVPTIATVLATGLCVGGFLLSGKSALLHPISKCIWIIVVLMVISIPTSLYPGMSVHFLWSDYLKTVLLFVIIATVIRSARKVEQMIIVHLVGCSMYCYFVITQVDI